MATRAQLVGTRWEKIVDTHWQARGPQRTASTFTLFRRMMAGPKPVRLPEHMRSVDLAPLIMELLEMPMRYRVGQSRASRML